MIEQKTCNLCGSSKGNRLFVKRGFHVLECQDCGLVYVSPRLTEAELKNLYVEEYFRSPNSLLSGYDDYVADRDNLLKTFRKRMKAIERYTEKGRLLDVGCAMGFLLDLLNQEGWETFGVELSDYASQYAREKLGLRIFTGTLTEAGFQDCYFDVITFWDAIEHSLDPTADLREAFRLLNRGGIISIITPNKDSLQARLAKSRWVEYEKPDEHPFFFSRKTMTKFLEKENFEVLEMRTAGKYVSLQFLINRTRAYDRRLARLAEWIVAPLGLASKVVYIDPRDKMFAIARKP